MNTLLIIMSHFDKPQCDTQPSVLPLDRMSANEGMPKLFVTVTVNNYTIGKNVSLYFTT